MADRLQAAATLVDPYRALVKRIASLNPIIAVHNGEVDYQCSLCKVAVDLLATGNPYPWDGSLGREPEKFPHAQDCPWVMARRLV